MRITKRALLCLCGALLLTTSFGCTATGPGRATIRPDGTPGPEECPEEALKAMRYLQLAVGDSALVTLDVNQTDTTPITLYEGPVESMVEDKLGPLESPARLYGRVWTDGPQVVIRYYAAQHAGGNRVPLCAVARLAQGQLKKLPGSKPGMAIVEFSVAAVYIVDEFR
ncbi:serine/threonine protein kinase [Stigmatella sp. ncwal1]|uniref:Serine/threonine protein kinase n=1 Tax=Stigmatella ashevillensis TaxID=2995309 RepID=A0ABT5DNG4_9BACT|nr:serine/threonine protein kinase [Stigmatella ashevillena]MDC0715192.1 serine/threonine protein kinase [Stigmatella ashevillena]